MRMWCTCMPEEKRKNNHTTAQKRIKQRQIYKTKNRIAGKKKVKNCWLCVRIKQQHFLNLWPHT